MPQVMDRIQEMIFEIGDLKNKARTYQEYELADATLQALRAKWEAYCKNSILAIEVKRNVKPSI